MASRVSLEKQRTVPSSTAFPETMLYLLPEVNLPTVTTAGSSGGRLRLTIVCRAITSAAAATVAYAPSYGAAPWQAAPVTVMVKLSLLA